MHSMKNTLKTVQVKFSKPPGFVETSWLKLRGRSSSIRPTVGRLSVTSIPPPVSAGNGGSGVQVAEPRFATGSSAIPASILPSIAPPPAVHAATPQHSPQPNQDIPWRIHSSKPFPVSASRVLPNVGTQITYCSPDSGSVLSEASHGSNGFSRSQGSRWRIESPYQTPYQTSIEPSPSPSLAGTSSANAFESTFSQAVTTRLARSPPSARGMSSHDYSVRSRSESRLSMNRLAIPDTINHIVETPRDLDGSKDAPTAVTELKNSPAVRFVRLETHPWYKKIKGAIQMPQESIPVRFKDTKKSIEATIPARAAAILPLEHKALPLALEDS
ncbi:hypothetical protein FRB94_005117 [Tulasnella sp. JGI-2019a]|nr:hypothetical protein FRB94_005117 [Tulasnella sp. JGI-2019a]